MLTYIGIGLAVLAILICAIGWKRAGDERDELYKERAKAREAAREESRKKEQWCLHCGHALLVYDPKGFVIGMECELNKPWCENFIKGSEPGQQSTRQAIRKPML